MDQGRSAGLPAEVVTNLQHPSTKREDLQKPYKRWLQCTKAGIGLVLHGCLQLLHRKGSRLLRDSASASRDTGCFCRSWYCWFRLEVGLIEFSSLRFLRFPFSAAVLQLEELTSITEQNQTMPQIAPNVVWQILIFGTLFFWSQGDQRSSSRSGRFVRQCRLRGRQLTSGVLSDPFCAYPKARNLTVVTSNTYNPSGPIDISQTTPTSRRSRLPSSLLVWPG